MGWGGVGRARMRVPTGVLMSTSRWTLWKLLFNRVFSSLLAALPFPSLLAPPSLPLWLLLLLPPPPPLLWTMSVPSSFKFFSFVLPLLLLLLPPPLLLLLLLLLASFGPSNSPGVALALSTVIAVASHDANEYGWEARQPPQQMPCFLLPPPTPLCRPRIFVFV